MPHPPALRHGLTSRYAREAARDQAGELATALIGASPATPDVMDAAYAAAEEFLHLHRVRRLRRLTFASGALPPAQGLDNPPAQTDLLHLTRATLLDDAGSRETARHAIAQHFGCSDDELVRIGQQALITSMAREPQDLRTLEEYERKACSRLRNALRRLDFERIEVERRRAASSTPPSEPSARRLSRSPTTAYKQTGH